MERFEVINVRTGTVGTLGIGKGEELELEQVESAHKLYPARISFLKLLGVLVHTPKQFSITRSCDGDGASQYNPGYRLLALPPTWNWIIHDRRPMSELH